MGKPPSPWPLQVPNKYESGSTTGCTAPAPAAAAAAISLYSSFRFPLQPIGVLNKVYLKYNNLFFSLVLSPDSFRPLVKVD